MWRGPKNVQGQGEVDYRLEEYVGVCEERAQYSKDKPFIQLQPKLSSPSREAANEGA